MTNGRRGSGARVAPPRDELGAHMSIAGGLHRALERGAELACGSVQIFLKNQRQWAAKPMADEDVRAFAAAWRATRTAAVFAHASYLINLGAPDDAAWRQAVDVFTDELERGEALGLRCVVIHPGSHMGRGVELGLARVTSALDEATRRTAGYRIRSGSASASTPATSSRPATISGARQDGRRPSRSVRSPSGSRGSWPST